MDESQRNTALHICKQKCQFKSSLKGDSASELLAPDQVVNIDAALRFLLLT